MEKARWLALAPFYFDEPPNRAVVAPDRADQTWNYQNVDSYSTIGRRATTHTSKTHLGATTPAKPKEARDLVSLIANIPDIGPLREVYQSSLQWLG
jgi:hypothetical protein